MPSGSLDSLRDAIDALDMALKYEKGLKLSFATRGAAVNFRQRIYTARKKDRELNRDSRPPDDPMFNRSVYDVFVIANPIEDMDAEGDLRWFLEVKRGKPPKMEKL